MFVTITVFLLVLALLIVFVLGVGGSIGWVLHWLLPQVDVGLSLLIGVVAGAASLHFVGRLIPEFDLIPPPESTDEDDAPVIHIVESAGFRRRRKKRSN